MKASILGVLLGGLLAGLYLFFQKTTEAESERARLEFVRRFEAEVERLNLKADSTETNAGGGDGTKAA